MDIPTVTKEGRKFDYIKGFWAVTAAAGILTLGLIGTGVVGAVNSTQRDNQITTENSQIARMKAQISDLKDQLEGAQDYGTKCENAASSYYDALTILATAIQTNSVTQADANQFQQDIKEGQNAGCDGSGS